MSRLGFWLRGIALALSAGVAAFALSAASYVVLRSSILDARAQQVVSLPSQVPSLLPAGTTATTGDCVFQNLSGTTWATAKIATSGTFNQVLTPTVTSDGINYTAAPFVRRLDVATANPALSATITANAGTYELPLPANATGVKVCTTATSGVATVSISAGQPFSTGMRVVAVLFDTTSAVNTPNNTGTLETAGWSQVTWNLTMNGGAPTFAVAEVDETGAAFGSIVTATAAAQGGLGPNTTLGGTAGTAAATAQLPVPRRLQVTSGAIVGQTTRVRVVAARGGG